MHRPLVWFAFFFVTTPLYAQQVGDQVIVVAPAEANLKVDSQAVGVIPRGIPLTVEKVDGDQFRVTWCGTSGWISKSDIASLDDAIALFDRVIAKESCAINYSGRGIGWLEKREYDRAIADFSEAIRLDAKWKYAYWGRARASLMKGDLDCAITDATKAIGIDPEFADAYRVRASTYHHKSDYDKAIADHTEAIRLEPNHPRDYFWRSYAYDQKGCLAKAIADLDTLNRLKPDCPHDYERLAVLWIRQGDCEKGARYLQTAIQLNPTDQAAIFEPWEKAKLSLKALKHGRRQLQQMLADRPNMAQYGGKADVLYQWAVQKFAGEDIHQEIFWDAAAPPPHIMASCMLPTARFPGYIRVRGEWIDGPNKGKERLFEDMWHDAVFELYNITCAKDRQRIRDKVARGTLSKKQYVTAIVESESQAAEKTRAFYIHLFLPWAAKQKLTSQPRLWYLGRRWKQHQNLLLPFAARDGHYWQSYESQYDRLLHLRHDR